MMKKYVSLASFLFLLFFGGKLYSADFSFKLTPAVTIPLDKEIRDWYSLGASFFLTPELSFKDAFSLGPDLSFSMISLLNTGNFSQCIGTGLYSGYTFYPLSRLSLHMGGAGGVYYTFYEDNVFGSLYWRAYGEIGLRLSPAMTVNAGAGYTYFHFQDSPYFQGVTAGLSIRLNINNRSAEGRLDLEYIESEPVYPLFFDTYQFNTIGSVIIENNETAEIRNIEIEFRSENFTNSTVLCGTAPILKRRESLEILLNADFSSALLQFSESGKIPGEVTVSYEILGEKRTLQSLVVIPVYNRNTLRWYDPAALAALIAPSNAEILDFSKYVVGLARNELRSGLNRNMQFAMYLFEGMKTSGIRYSPDDITPYLSTHKDPEQLDYIQFPTQTLFYKMGDMDELGLLFAALAESVGIKTAIIPLENEFLVAFSLDINSAKASGLFYDFNDLLIINDEVWIPLSFSKLNEGFINCWTYAMNNLNQTFQAGERVDFIVLRDAWQTYPSAMITGENNLAQKPGETQLIKAVELNLLRYINSEMGPKIQDLMGQLESEGRTTATLNRLGLVYVRSGMLEEATAVYLESERSGSFSAKINLGNISLLQEDYEQAEKWFKKALEEVPDNRAAQRGLDRAQDGLLDG